MTENVVTVYEQPNVVSALCRNNYTIKIGDKECTLKRDVDFGKVPKAKSPSLWKSGAEKILMAFGLLYDVEVIDSYKDYNKGFFYYECKATAYFDGKIVRVGVGCANTSESSNGTASGFNQANSALKKAKKRAIVDLALTLHKTSRTRILLTTQAQKFKVTRTSSRANKFNAYSLSQHLKKSLVKKRKSC